MTVTIERDKFAHVKDIEVIEAVGTTETTYKIASRKVRTGVGSGTSAMIKAAWTQGVDINDPAAKLDRKALNSGWYHISNISAADRVFIFGVV